MTPSSSENRLADVLEGPWAQKAVEAEAFLTHKRQTTLTLQSSGSSARPGPPSRVRSAELNNVFRAHWRHDVTDAQEIRVRDSFDEALNTLQLLELGIEMGYYSVEQLRDTVVAKFDELFWSEAAVNYLAYYEYVSVRFLAARYGIDLGLPPLMPPAPTADAEVQYATFLSIYAQFYQDTPVKAWLLFLDDYQFPGEQLAFAEFLTRHGVQPANDPLIAHFQNLSKGAYQFILYLNDVFKVVESAEQKYLALFFSYWLARLTGYRLTDAGYTQAGTDWASLVSQSPQQVLLANGYASDGETADDAAAIEQLLQQRVGTIQQAWLSAKTEIESRTKQ